MKNKIYIFIITFLVFQFGNAQSNFYYYYKGNKVFLELDKSKVNIITNQSFNTIETSNIGLKNYTLEQDEVLTTNKLARTEFISEPSTIEFYQKLNLLKSKPNIKSLGLYFKRNGTTSIGTSNFFYVKLKTSNDFQLLQNYCLQRNVQVVKQIPYMPEWYILSTTNPQFTSLELSNQFYESGLFADVDPAFMFNFRNNCTNDPMFGSLWGLNNTNNPNYDINACQAWSITQGNGINVAVIDTGIDLQHNDLVTNIHPLSYDCQTQTSPSILRPQYSWYDHGTHVAGTIGAIKDNGFQVVGVAPYSKLMSISHALAWMPTLSADLASGFSWAWQNGADVINNSWGDPDPNGSNLGSPLLENAINNAINLGRNGLGCIVVFATGNENSGLRYPASQIQEILAVGSITSSGFRSSFSNFGNLLDVVAPGSSILSTLPNNQVGSKDGTSMACPHVAGIAALVLSVNQCLTGQQVRDIIEQTAQKINPNNNTYFYSNISNRPNGTWNNQMGYGLVDAHAAVLMAQSMGSTTLDLYVKDSQEDIGAEPNTVTQYMWTSNDIWVRNYNDNGLTHQNPDYSANGNPNFVRVRVINKSCVTSSGNEQLKLYWAKAATDLSWPNHWDGSIEINNIPFGGEVGTLNIPVLQPGEETIVTFPWNVPNPDDYNNINSEPWHFCLLARIVASNDPMTFPETWDVNANTRNNNNIAWKNVTVVDVLPNNIVNPGGNIGGVIAVGNPFDHPRTFFLEMIKEDIETGKAIYEEAEVGVKMDDILYQAWERGGKEAQLLDETLDEKRRIVKGNNVILDNLLFEPKERGTLYLSFNFLTKELTEKSNYRYHVIQRDAVTGNIIGGETYEINKPYRTPFEAIADDKEVDLNQAITISAEDINEPAVYNWYDSEGNLIYQGKDLEIANAVAEKYKLEVISTLDGFKDYKEVEVKLKPSSLETIAPNPANNNVVVSYKLNGASSAYLMVIGYYGSNGTSNNYVLDVSSNQINLNISNYQNGFYTVALVVNGEIIDAKTLIKQ